jgi:hypothetical protein
MQKYICWWKYASVNESQMFSSFTNMGFRSASQNDSSFQIVKGIGWVCDSRWTRQLG